MAKTMPKYMVDKLTRINELIYKAQALNEEVEQWLEDNLVTVDGYDFIFEYRDTAAYGINNVGEFVRDVNRELASK